VRGSGSSPISGKSSRSRAITDGLSRRKNVFIFELCRLAAVQIRPVSGWGWMLANGVITLLLGWMLWKQWPLSGAWAVGVLFGVQLISTGASLLAIGGAVRSMAKAVEA